MCFVHLSVGTVRKFGLLEGLKFGFGQNVRNGSKCSFFKEFGMRVQPAFDQTQFRSSAFLGDFEGVQISGSKENVRFGLVLSFVLPS